MTLGTYLLLIIVPMLLGLWAQFRVKSAFGRYSQMRAHSNMSGADAAREVLSAAQIHDVEVV
jgi:Zn-dependent membrane protease YugP